MSRKCRRSRARWQAYRRLVVALREYGEFCTQYEGADAWMLRELDEQEIGYLYEIRDAATEVVGS